MKRMFTVALVVMMAVPVAEGAAKKRRKRKSSAKATEPAKIFEQVDEAARAVKAVSYDLEFDVKEGGNPGTLRHMEGKMWLVAGPDKKLASFRADLKYTGDHLARPRDFTAIYDGKNYFRADHHRKTARKGDNGGKILQEYGQPIALATMHEFVHPTPFSDEVNAPTVELLGSEEVGGVDCHKLHVHYAREQYQAIWFIGKEDYLPRGVIRINKGDQARKASRMQLILSGLQVDPEIPDDAFDTSLPEGYTEKSGKRSGSSAME